MALSAILTLSEAPGVIIMTDNTVYGGGNPERSAVTVEFVLTHHLSSGDVDVPLSYDAAVDLVVQVAAQDSWYTGQITIKDGGGATLSTITAEIVKTEALVVCKASKLTAYACDCCDNLLQDYPKMGVGLYAINEAVGLNDYKSAQCIVENLQCICSPKDDCEGC